MDFDFPIWGKFGGFGILLGAVVWVFYAVLNGKLVTGSSHESALAAERERSAVDLASARQEAAELLAAAEKRSEKWQEAYQASQSVQAQTTATLSKVTSLSESFERFLIALQKAVPLPGLEADDE